MFLLSKETHLMKKGGNQNFILLDRPGIDKKQRAALYNEQHAYTAFCRVSMYINSHAGILHSEVLMKFSKDTIKQRP